MRRLFIIAVLLMTITGTVFAQDETWKPGESDFEYNCTALEQVQAVIGDSEATLLDIAELPLARANNVELSVERYLSLMVLLQFQQDADASLDLDALIGDAVSACNAGDNASASTSGDTFNVTVNSNANMRSCAGTNCNVVAQVAAGKTLKVVAVEGEWYEVEHEGGTAFIATFLTARAPDNLISTDEAYRDERTGCVVAFDVKRGDADMSLILAGDRRSDVLADLYRPNESAALKVEAQLDKTFIDTGEPYILQYYSWNVGWPVGIYGLEITLDGQTSKVAWEVEERGDYNVYVLCD